MGVPQPALVGVKIPAAGCKGREASPSWKNMSCRKEKEGMRGERGSQWPLGLRQMRERARVGEADTRSRKGFPLST